MNRPPALMDPRTPLVPPPERPARMIPWGFVWLGVATLTLAAAVAYVSLNGVPGAALLNVRSPGSAADPGKPAADSSAASGTGLSRAVAIAYVDVEQGVTPLYPVRPGRVAAVFIKEGDEVEKDMPLVQIDDELSRQQLAEAELALKGARIGKEKAEQLLIQHQGMTEAQEALVAVRERTVAKAEAGLAKARHFYNERLGGSLQDIEIQKQELEEARAAVEAERKKLDALRKTDPSAAVRAADLDIQAKQQQIEKAKSEIARHVLRAPAKGKILRSWVTVGETLGTNPHRPAMEFCPDAERIIRAEVEQEYAGLVRSNMKATIQDFDGNGTAWEGEVSRVSDWISKRRSQVFEPLQFNDVRTLEVIIRLKTQPQYPLRIGQRVRVTLER